MNMEDMLMGIYANLGTAACLEQLAEKCAELSKAALVLAKNERGENPTNITLSESMNDYCNSAADVNICLNVLQHSPVGIKGEHVREKEEYRCRKWFNSLID